MRKMNARMIEAATAWQDYIKSSEYARACEKDVCE
jgi:hypothetical protein